MLVRRLSRRGRRGVAPASLSHPHGRRGARLAQHVRDLARGPGGRSAGAPLARGGRAGLRRRQRQRARMSATGDTQQLARGRPGPDPARDRPRRRQRRRREPLRCVSVQSPPVVRRRALRPPARGPGDAATTTTTTSRRRPRRAALVIRAARHRPRPRPGRLLPRHRPADGRVAAASPAGSATTRTARVEAVFEGAEEAVDGDARASAAEGPRGARSSAWRCATRSPRA